MTDSKKPTISEIRVREGVVADNRLSNVGYLLDLVKRMGKALSTVAEELGASGTGEHDREIYYCERCAQCHEDWTKIPHKQDCLVAQARALLEELKQ